MPLQTSQNPTETATIAAPAGGVTAFTLKVVPTTLVALLPLATAGSGVSVVCKIRGIVGGVTKSTSTAFVHGAPLQINTAGAAVAPSSAGQLINAYAWGDANSSNSTMDVELVYPIAS